MILYYKNIDCSNFMEISDNKIISMLGTERNFGRDELCRFEDYILKKYKNAMWSINYKILEKEICKKTVSDFLLGDIKLNKLTSEQFIPFLSLPYSDCAVSIYNLMMIWDMYRSNEYFEKTGTNVNFCNLPGGCVYANNLFIGEAPGICADSCNYGGRVYTFGKTSMTFRLCSQYVFGKLNWYTNISKSAIIENKKLTGKELEYALKCLKFEIETINPLNVICLGNYVYETVLKNFSDTIKIFGIKVSKIYHPAYIYRNGNNFEYYIDNMKEIFNDKEKYCSFRKQLAIHENNVR